MRENYYRKEHSMKKIGLVGGIGPASTVEYYLGIIEKNRIAHGDNIYPEIVIDSVNMAQHDKALAEKDYDKLCGYLLSLNRKKRKAKMKINIVPLEKIEIDGKSIDLA